MITTVTLNPAIDKVVEISNMSLGAVHRVDSQVVSFGGKSINVARILSGLKCGTSAVCYLGKSNYDEIIEFSIEDGLNLKPILLKGLTRTNVKIVEPDHNYRTTDINEAGFEVSKEELLEMIRLIKQEASKSEYVVLSGSLPKGVDKTFYKKMAEELKAVTRVIIDADGEVLLSSMEGSPFLIKPNIHELESATAKTIGDEHTIIDVCRELIERYAITYILVSRGELGSILVGKDIVLSAGILPVKVVSTVGAGDSMLAGMIYGLVQGDASNQIEYLKTALSLGVASSSIAISTQEHKTIESEVLWKRSEEVVIKDMSI